MFRLMRVITIPAIVWALTSSPHRAAADPPKKAQPLPESFQMLLAIAKGSRMGPGHGWFHAGQSRYGWKWLAERCDKDKNGTITPEEFGGTKESFTRLDRNRDKALKAEDFDLSDRSGSARQGMMSAQAFRKFDQNSNGRISMKEWEALFQQAAKGKDYLTPDDVQELLQPPALPRPGEKMAHKDEPSKTMLLMGLLKGELGSFAEGPQLGQEAPDFSLPTENGKRTIRLSDYRGKKPVVLIFGSFT